MNYTIANALNQLAQDWKSCPLTVSQLHELVSHAALGTFKVVWQIDDDPRWVTRRQWLKSRGFKATISKLPDCKRFTVRW